MTIRSWKFSACLCALAAVLWVQACKQTEQPKEEAVAASSTPCRASTALPDPNSPELDCAAPPSTFEVSSFFAGSPPPAMAQAGPTFDSWAWASFAAYNWPAEASTSQPTGYLRGVPDLDSSFLNASGTDVLVWETFKEKREVFNNNVTASGWQQLTFSPDQTINTEGGQVQPCSTQDRDRAAKLPGGAHRRILQASKLAPALGTGPNTLDETAEVSSPAQEAQNALCAGYTATTNPTLADCQTTFPPPPGGSGSTVYPINIVNPRPGVGPRVYDPNNNLVYYEVRLNYDYFNYVLQNQLNFVNPVGTPPKTPTIQPPYSLPWRTSAQGPPNTAQQRSSVVNYDPNATVTSYGTMPTTPPTIGSVQVKSAWMQLQSADPTYHTTEAVYFMTPPGGGVCYSVGLFGLLSLHIIQRVHMGDSGDANADPVGGTFIFATWEHNSIGSGSGYSYVSFIASGGEDQGGPGEPPLVPYPTVANAIPVTRQQPYPLATTNNVTQAVYNQLPANSVWRNYRLIGTQFYANVTQTTSPQYNQPFFLANLVVETNNGLQNFQGLPPNITPISQYNPNPPGTEFTPTGPAYNPNVPNVSFNGNPENMGGCMGCHGVAQLLGSNFSFVLLDGQKGAGIDTSTQVSIPPDPPPSSQ